MELLPMDEKKPVVRLVYSNGTVECVHTSVRAQHFLKDFPEHSICHAKSLYINRKTPVLDAAEALQPGNLYFLLPKRLLESPLTLPALLSLGSYPRRLRLDYHPLVLENTDNKGFCLHVSSEFVTKLLEGPAITPFKPPKLSKGLQEEQDLLPVKGCYDEVNKCEDPKNSASGSRRLCSTAQLQKEYERLVCSRCFRRRPSLETIMEGDETLPRSRRRALKSRLLKGCMGHVDH